MPFLNDPILVFTLLALVMLIMPLLAERLRMPDMVLLLAAGLLLGPHGLNLLARNSAVTLFGSVGLLYIMFLAGLEIDLHHFARTRARSVLFGLLTFSIPQLFGTLAARYLLNFSWPTAILLASLLASHTLLAYPIASRLGIARSEPVAVTLGATIITDTLALLVLAVVVDASRGLELGFFFWLHIGAGLIALVLLAWWGIPFLTRWFFQQVTEAGGAQFLFVLVTVCGFSYLSHFAKMEPIIGAFLAGAAFSRLIPERSALMSRVVFAGNTLFIPFFLISVGMLIDPSALLKNSRSWLVGGTMVTLVIASKYTAAWLAGKLFGYSPAARRVMFGLSVVQAAATLAAVLVGYNLAIFDDTVFNGAIAMILVTCPLGAWMVDRHGRNLAAETEFVERRPPATGQRILVPVARADHASKLLDLAYLLRDTTLPGSIHPITIVRDADDVEEALTRGEKLLADCFQHAASANIAIEPAVRVDVNASDGITRAVKELHADLVLTGWGGTRIASFRLFGSVMEKLIAACPSRLLFCRLKQPFNTTRRLLVILPPLAERRNDFTPLLRDAKNLARQVGAELRIYLSNPNRESLRQRVQTATPSQPLAFVEAETWAEARAKFLAEIGPNDMLLALGERRVSTLWSPTMDNLASLLVSRFPSANLLLAYPALAGLAEAMPSAFDPEGDVPSVYSCELNSEMRLERVLHRMVATACPERRTTVDEAKRLLLVAAKSYPVELLEGTTLLHAHCDTIDRAILIVGRGTAQWEIPNVPHPARVLLALLNPTSSTPERHLRVLAELGRRFSDPATVAAVRSATSAAEIANLLAKPVVKKGTP
jgi:Kef-type K+ transport system membrane component KefB/nucleotide-binding universal stress UspA family protein/mannitol/fructose-specific phosphotransferase system IIA component (Ntr-type)